MAKIAGLVMGAAAGAVASYPLLWREWCLTWGATEEEARATLPGDDLLLQPDLLTSRAITVAAPPSRIWPWLVQMGSERGGAYTYDWIENLFGLNMHSADEILPQFQDLHHHRQRRRVHAPRQHRARPGPHSPDARNHRLVVQQSDHQMLGGGAGNAREKIPVPLPQNTQQHEGRVGAMQPTNDITGRLHNMSGCRQHGCSTLPKHRQRVNDGDANSHLRANSLPARPMPSGDHPSTADATRSYRHEHAARRRHPARYLSWTRAAHVPSVVCLHRRR